MNSVPMKNGDHIIWLAKGEYNVFLSGGWGCVISPYFKWILTCIQTQKRVEINSRKFVRDKLAGIRCIRIAQITVPESKEYQLTVINAEDVKVWRSNLFSMRLLQQSLPTTELKLLILPE